MRTKQIAKVPKGVIGLQEPVTGMSREHPRAGPPRAASEIIPSSCHVSLSHHTPTRFVE